MKINSTDKYTCITAQGVFDTFLVGFDSLFSEYNTHNLIIDFSGIAVTEDQINKLQKYVEAQFEHQKSFVIITPSFDADIFEEELNVVPTLTEAIDIIDMDEMTRDLGF